MKAACLLKNGSYLLPSIAFERKVDEKEIGLIELL